MKIERKFTKAGSDAYSEVPFGTTTSEIRNPDGTIVFRQENLDVSSSSAGSSNAKVIPSNSGNSRGSMSKD